jgi:CheY-like chemotaxis protein
MENNTGFSFQSVLIVDDSEIDVLVNRRLMELTHFASQVVITHDGAEALRFLKDECSSAASAPDWIFLDMHLPVMNGFEFIEAFKKLPSHIRNKTKIIVLSVMHKPELMAEILKNDFVFGRMEKPLTQKALTGLAEGKTTTVSSI